MKKITDKDYYKFLDTKNYNWCYQNEAARVEQGIPIENVYNEILVAQSKQFDYYKVGKYLVSSPFNSFRDYKRLGLFKNYIRECYGESMSVCGGYVANRPKRFYINKALIREQMKMENEK